jgi:hypothetical protein
MVAVVEQAFLIKVVDVDSNTKTISAEPAEGKMSVSKAFL